MYITDDHICTHNTIIAGALSELTTFTDEGWSEEKILKFFTKLRKRIDSRMKGNYYGRFYLDSQPNTLESCIDKWIWEDAPKDPKNFILTGSRWKYFPEDFPKFYDENHVEKHDFTNGFPLFLGGNGQPAQVLHTQAQVDSHESTDLEWCPVEQITDNGVVNFKNAAEENPIEFIRDWCGRPSGAADRILYNPDWIDHTFDNPLKSVFSTLNAPKELDPEHLIWDQVYQKFFNKLVDKYYFYYEPQIPRVASVDLAITGDTASISVSHVEYDPTKKDSQGEPEKVYVTDFVIPIIPKESIINLDAFKYFLIDLVTLGNMNIKHVSFDGFQSRSIMQALERFGFEVDLLSVDKDNTPYKQLIDIIQKKRYYCGKNIMVKNNMLALQISKRKTTGTIKIDHKKGDNVYTDSFCGIDTEYNEESWTKSQVGRFAKDTTDCIAGNIALLSTYDTEYVPIVAWNPQNLVPRSYETVKASCGALAKNLGFIIK